MMKFYMAFKHDMLRYVEMQEIKSTEDTAKARKQKIQEDEEDWTIPDYAVLICFNLFSCVVILIYILIWFCDLTSENFAETAVFRCFPIADATCAGCASRDQQIAGRLGPGNRCTEEAPHRASVRGTEKRAELEMALTHLETLEIC